MIRSAIEDWNDPSGDDFRCKSGNPGRLWVLDGLRDDIETTNRPYSTP